MYTNVSDWGSPQRVFMLLYVNSKLLILKFVHSVILIYVFFPNCKHEMCEYKHIYMTVLYWTSATVSFKSMESFSFS